MTKKNVQNFLLSCLAIVVSLGWFFPIAYMIISSFKTEVDVIVPSLFFTPTLENYLEVMDETFFLHLKNSILATLGTVIVTTLLAVPASYALVFTPLKNRDGVYFWFISTTFLPAIAVIVPVYLIFQNIGLVDEIGGLIVLYCGAGIPLMVWIVTNFFKEIPITIVEAAELDGSSRLQSFIFVMLPLVRNGIISAALLVFVITWNEFFFAVTITYSEAATLPVYMSKYMTQQGYYWAKMSATGTLISIIPMVLGFFTQKALVKGLTSGSVKG